MILLLLFCALVVLVMAWIGEQGEEDLYTTPELRAFQERIHRIDYDLGMKTGDDDTHDDG